MRINLYGEPGAGKSATANTLAGALKRAGYPAVFIGEYAHELNNMGVKITAEVQREILLEQIRRERVYLAYRPVPWLVVTESPVFVSVYHGHYYYGETVGRELAEICRVHEAEFTDSIDFFLKRDFAYDPRGRYQNEEEAAKFRQLIAEMLQVHYAGRELLEVPSSNTDLMMRHVVNRVG